MIQWYGRGGEVHGALQVIMQYIQVNLSMLLWLLLLCSMRVYFSVMHQKVIAVNEIILYVGGRGREGRRGREGGGAWEGEG